MYINLKTIYKIIPKINSLSSFIQLLKNPTLYNLSHISIQLQIFILTKILILNLLKIHSNIFLSEFIQPSNLLTISFIHLSWKIYYLMPKEIHMFHIFSVLLINNVHQNIQLLKKFINYIIIVIQEFIKILIL